MSNKIVKLESETAAWKLRWEKTQKALIEMASEKQKSDQEIVLAAKQMATLHKLCRTLQSERTQLLAKLKQSKILLVKHFKMKQRININVSLILGSSPNDSTESSSNSDVTNLLETKIIDENLRASKNYAEEKDANNEPKIQTKSSQAAEKSPGVPKTKSKNDKKHPASTQRDCGQNNTVKVEEINTAVSQININGDLQNQNSPVKAVPSENPIPASAEKISVSNDDKITETPEHLPKPEVSTSASSTDSSPVEVIKSDLKNELPHLPSDNSGATVEEIGEQASSAGVLQEKTLMPSDSEAKISASLSENASAPVESVLKNSVQSNKKKVSFFLPFFSPVVHFCLVFLRFDQLIIQGKSQRQRI